MVLILSEANLLGGSAFEMAQQLSAQGQKVALLALFDTYFPGDLRYLSSSHYSVPRP